MVTIYTKDTCPYCHKALALLDSLKVEYKNIDVTHNPEKLQEAIAKSGFTTVPQIFANGKCLGGYDDIYKLHTAGKLLDFIK